MSSIDMSWLGKVLPTVAAAFGGPLAGVAAGFIADKLGLSEKTVESVQQAIAGMNPEQLVSMKQIDADLQKYFAGLEIKLEELYIDDRKDARARESQVKDNTPRILAYIVVCSFIAVVASTLMGWSKAESVLAGTLIGYLSAKAEQVMGYYFGSTKGSAEKTKQLINQAKESGK